jgi:hypothetical protein
LQCVGVEPGVIGCAPDELDLETIGVDGVHREVHPLIDGRRWRSARGRDGWSWPRPIHAAAQPRIDAMQRTFGALSADQRVQLRELLGVLRSATLDASPEGAD